MLTVREAKQRLEQYQMSLSREGASSNWRVTYSEDDYRTAMTNCYVTDDIEDAMFEGIKMRGQRMPEHFEPIVKRVA